jgi:hypothetical protein
LTATYFSALKQLLGNEAHEMHTILENIKRRLDSSNVLEGEDEMTKLWAAHNKETPAPAVYEKSIAGLWREVGCDSNGAPYVIYGLIDRLSGIEVSGMDALPFRDKSDEAKALATAFLDEARCPGAHGLSESDKAKLIALRDRAPLGEPQAPKP